MLFGAWALHFDAAASAEAGSGGGDVPTGEAILTLPESIARSFAATTGASLGAFLKIPPSPGPGGVPGFEA